MKRQRCVINKRDNNKILNLVLIALSAILVLAVAAAVVMAGRIRKQEEARQSAPAEVTAGAQEEPGQGALAAEGEPEGQGEATTGQTEASSGGGSSEVTAEAGSAGSGKLPEGDEAAAAAEGGSQEDASAAGSTDAGSGTKAPFVKTVHVEVDGKTVLETPLTGESKYAIIDGRAVELEVETTLEDMQGLADPANHDVNLIYIHDGKVSCSESNCENQVCVHTGEMTGSAFDLPIICLPHGVVVQVID